MNIEDQYNRAKRENKKRHDGGRKESRKHLAAEIAAYEGRAYKLNESDKDGSEGRLKPVAQFDKDDPFMGPARIALEKLEYDDKAGAEAIIRKAVQNKIKAHCGFKI